MSNPYYNYTSNLPADHTKGTAATVRSELSSIGAGFDAVDTAIDAVFAGGGLSSASSTSLTVGTGSKSLTVATGLSFAAGQYVIIADTAAPTTNYMEGRITSYSSTTGAMVVDATIDAGSGTYSSWTVSLQGQVTANRITRRAITGTDTIISSDLGKLIDITSGTFTLSGTAAATLGAGFFCHLRNSGTGVVTFDPASSEAVDALTTIKVYPGESFLIQCDGSNWHTVGRQRVVLISTSTVGSPVASVDFETGFDDTEFDEIIVRCIKVTHNGGVARNPWARTKHGGSYVTTSTYDCRQASNNAGTLSAAGGAAVGRYELNGTNSVAVGAAFNVDFRCQNLAAAGNGEHAVKWEYVAAGAANFTVGGGSNSSGAALQGLRLLMNADSISGGTFSVYGVRKS